ncbi:hypothetical protein SCUP234_11892 [Seiridium cupressi]
MNQDALPSRSRGPRLYHKKSRTGCIRCKQRRVKCDETRPSCSGCSRHMVDCIYPAQAATTLTAPKPAVQSTGDANAQHDFRDLSAVDVELGQLKTPATSLKPSSPSGENSTQHLSHHASPSSSTPDFIDDVDESDLDFPESRERRLWELRLLHNSLTQATPFPTPQPQQIQTLFSLEVPNMAFKEGRDAILYGIMAHSALNLWTRSTDPQERETLIRLQRTYLSMLLRQQRKDVADLNPSNADSICLCSLKLVTHALALIQTLPLEPWQPPIDFLQMGNGAGIVFQTAWAMVKKEGGGEVSKMLTFLRNPPILSDPNETIFSDHSALDWILETPPGPNAHLDTEMNDVVTRSVYEKAISYICSVQRALDRSEPEFAICRRLGGFTVWIPYKFTRFLLERRPRAMVVMAHFMSLFLAIDHIWVIGRAGETQIRGIHKNLPVEWRYKLDGLFQKFRKPEDAPPPFSGGFGAMM